MFSAIKLSYYVGLVKGLELYIAFWIENELYHILKRIVLESEALGPLLYGCRRMQVIAKQIAFLSKETSGQPHKILAVSGNGSNNADGGNKTQRNVRGFNLIGLYYVI